MFWQKVMQKRLSVEGILVAFNMKLHNKFTFVSTGGGAMLDFLAGKKLPGIEAIERSQKKLYN